MYFEVLHCTSNFLLRANIKMEPKIITFLVVNLAVLAAVEMVRLFYSIHFFEG